MSDAPVVLIAGNPNAGKTTVFNLLTGASAKVGNYPGVTVDRRSGRLAVSGRSVEIVDLPGTYSLTSRSAEEKISVDAILGDPLGQRASLTRPTAIVLVLDATTLRRGLYFATQVLGTGIPVVLALNMMDEAKTAGIDVDAAALARALGCEVVPMVARRSVGKRELVDAIGRAIEAPLTTEAREAFEGPLGEDVEAIDAAVRTAVPLGSELSPAFVRTLSIWALLSLGEDELASVPASLRSAVEARQRRAAESGRALDEAIIAARYAAIDRITAAAMRPPRVTARRLSDRIDAVLVHPVWGLLIFACVMVGVFEALFSGAEPLMDLVQAGAGWLKGLVIAHMGEGAFRDLLVQGVISGVGNVVVFVPQIALLFIFITVLEDSGYLARVAFVIDRVMGRIGLNGRAFVPMLSGFACAIPAVMATRTIESRKDRLLTMLVIPLSSCSARLPVYVLLAGTVFPPGHRVLGLFSPGAVCLFAMYTLSIVFSIGAAFVLRRTVVKGPKPPLVLELPPYRAPGLWTVAVSTWERVRRFLIDAGTVILALTIALWAVLAYPKDPAVHAKYEAERATAAQIEDLDARKEALAAIDHQEAGEDLRGSLGGRLGTAIEPALKPLGFDYRIGVGILGAFAAREVFVSTLGIVFDLGDEADEEDEGLRAALREAKNPDGSPLFTPLVGVSLMVFFVLACQCMSTLAVVRRESGSWKYPLLLFGYMTALAYGVTLLVFQVGRALGWGMR
ncbi:MAG: ferrous iron transport protein B [Polyangiaceae bacterium]